MSQQPVQLDSTDRLALEGRVQVRDGAELRGTFGSVATRNYKGIRVAVKLFDGLSGEPNRTAQETLGAFRREKDCVIRLQGGASTSPYILRCFFYSEGGTEHITVFEPAIASLAQVVDEKYSEVCSVDRVLKLSKDCANGLAFMHSAGYIHGDVQPLNMLLFQNYNTLKLCGFTSSCPISQVSPQNPLGSLLYRAPESGLGPPIPKSDIFSWSTSFCLILQRDINYGLRLNANGQRELIEEDEWMTKVRHNGRRPTLPSATQMPHAFINLLAGCWSHDPTARPSAERVAACVSGYDHLTMVPAMVSKASGN